MVQDIVITADQKSYISRLRQYSTLNISVTVEERHNYDGR